MNPTDREQRIRSEYNRFAAGLARLAPLHLRISSQPGGGSYCVDTGVWARRCHPGGGAPAGAGPVNAVLFAAAKFPTDRIVVAADERSAAILADALAHLAHIDRDADRETQRALCDVAGHPISAASLVALAELTDDTTVTVTHDPGVSYLNPVGLPSTRMRYGSRAEGAYHELCARHGYRMISVDGAALAARSDGRCAAWGWAWWDTPQRWAAGGGLGSSSGVAEITAALEALRAHPDERLAVTYDWVGIGRIAAAAAGLRVGAADPTTLQGAARQLHDTLVTRPAGAEVIWLPLSAKSSSRRHQLVDRLARSARIAAAGGDHGPWDPRHPIAAA